MAGNLGRMQAHRSLDDGQVRLRPAAEGDFSFLRRLFDEPAVLVHWGGVAFTDTEIRRKYLGARSPLVECFIVEAADRPVGLAQHHSVAGEHGGGMDMVLLPGNRGQGVGTAAVQLLATFVRDELGWRRFTVDPDVSNARGVSFWRSVGFVPVELVDADPDREPFWRMEWHPGAERL